jgi:hypothetical protein
MVATVVVYEGNGGTPTKTDVSNINFGSADGPNLVVATYPISFTNSGTYYSWEKYIGLHISGTFNTVNNLQWWMATTPSTGVALYSSNTANTVYANPSILGAAVSSKATNACPTSDPGTANIGIAGGFANAASSSTETWSDYVCVQLRITGSSAAPGNMTQLTFTFQYDEQ